MANLFSQHFQLVSDVDQNLSTNIQSLSALQRSNSLTAQDFKDYTSPYDKLSRSLVQMVDPTAMGYSNLLYTPRDPYYSSSVGTGPI